MIPAGRPESGEVGMGPHFDCEPFGHAGRKATVRGPGHGSSMMSGPRRPRHKGAEGHQVVACSDADYKGPLGPVL